MYNVALSILIILLINMTGKVEATSYAVDPPPKYRDVYVFVAKGSSIKTIEYSYSEIYRDTDTSTPPVDSKEYYLLASNISGEGAVRVGNVSELFFLINDEHYFYWYFPKNDENQLLWTSISKNQRGPVLMYSNGDLILVCPENLNASEKNRCSQYQPIKVDNK